MSPLRRISRFLPLTLSLLLVAGCASGGGGRSSPFDGKLFPSIFGSDLSARQPKATGSADASNGSTAPRASDVVYLGSASPDGGKSDQTVSSHDPGEFSLNFQNADIREVIQAILGNSLHETYTVDPNVSGTVTMASARPLSKDDLLPILESVLQMNGAAAVRDGKSYRIVATDSAVSGRGDVGEARPGYGMTILPLKYVSAQSLTSLIDGFGTRPGSVRVEAARNLLVILGNGPDREAAVNTALSFDADWMRDQSVAILPLQNAKPEALIPELERVFASGENGVGTGLVQFMPMTRLKAVLAVAKRRDLIERARVWVRRLDNKDAGLESDIFVYRMKYRDASIVATILNQLFSGASSTSPTSPNGQVTPDASSILSAGVSNAESSLGTMSGGNSLDSATGSGSSNGSPGSSSGTAGYTGSGSGSSGQTGTTGGNGTSSTTAVSTTTPGGTTVNVSDTTATGNGPRIQADTSNNSVVIYADRETRQKIVSALARLDVPQLQVAINVTMAEVRLTDELKFGIQYFIKSKSLGLGNDNGSIGLFNTAANAIARDLPGFNFVLGSSKSPDVIISALDAVTDVHVLSSPSLVVMENEIAHFQVGDQIPIVTQTLQQPATTGSGNNFTTSNEVEYRDTGIILSVKPRIAENGTVSMLIQQQISSVTQGSNSLTPTISNRQVSSSISVVDGQTVLLGGLISEQTSHAKSGIPGLSRLRVIGNLFGSTNNENNRTELIILIRPSVIRESQDAQHVAEELRSKLWALGAAQAR
jgi:general secretion pathway protein D